MSQRFGVRKVAVLAAIVAAAALPASASASTCGNKISVNHSSSWNLSSSQFESTGCLVQGDYQNGVYTSVYASGAFRVSGTAGVQPYTMRLTLQDVTDGRVASVVSSPQSWAESWPDVVDRTWRFSTPKLSTVKGHKYAVWAWDTVDLANDGKGTFKDPYSYATWTK